MGPGPAIAKSLIDDSLKVQSDLLKLKKKYLKKFRRVRAPKTVARFYQIENKLDAISNLTMARGIPLVEDQIVENAECSR